jgi:glycerol uptake facilitator protein
METYSLGRRAAAETLGTTLLVLVGPGSVVATPALAAERPIKTAVSSDDRMTVTH